MRNIYKIEFKYTNDDADKILSLNIETCDTFVRFHSIKLSVMYGYFYSTISIYRHKFVLMQKKIVI